MKLQQPSRRLLAYLSGLCAVAALAFTASYTITSAYGPRGAAAISDDLVRNCARANTPAQCYADGFGTITRQHGTGMALTVLKEYQGRADAQTGCHFIAHQISAEAVDNADGDWRAVLQDLPLSDCNGGFLMGVIEARQLRDPGLGYTAATIVDTCEDIGSQPGLEQTCTHTMGHLTLVQTSGSVPDALAICGGIADAHHLQECLSGVFMENMFRRNIAAHGKGKHIPWTQEREAELQELCTSHSGAAKTACWRELSHLFVQREARDLDSISVRCNAADVDEARSECYEHAVGIIRLLQPKNSSE